MKNNNGTDLEGTMSKNKQSKTSYSDDYKKLISDIKTRFKSAQIKASTSVNSQMLLFYWDVGKHISSKEWANRYGVGFYQKLSSDLKNELPDIKSFSPRNLRYMADFYNLYSPILQQPVAKSDEKVIFQIPWGHHIQIITKCKDNKEKALFFVNKTLENNWSRAVLLNFLDTNLYERQGKAITNFENTLPSIGSDLAKEITKDPYNFDFLTLREHYDEKELKDALMDNIQNFLLELGKGFAFVGREYRLVIGETEQFLDMLFYNIYKHCYVVIEIKTRPFDPGDMGQLGTYVAAVDGIIRLENDNPTIGLLICKTKDNVLAQYALNATNVPTGISEYEMGNLIPDDFKGTLPTIEEIEEELGKEL